MQIRGVSKRSVRASSVASRAPSQRGPSDLGGGISSVEGITELLRAGARSDAGVAVISGGTSRQQETVTGTLADIGVRFKARPGLPTLMIVGDTVQIAAELAAGCRDTAPVSSATAPAARPTPGSASGR